MIKYINYSIGYEINEYLFLIGVNQDGKIVYDKKYLFCDINFRKIKFNLLSNNVRYVLISKNMINRKIKRNANRYSEDLFDEKFINDLNEILNISNIQTISFLISIKKQVYFYKNKMDKDRLNNIL